MKKVMLIGILLLMSTVIDGQPILYGLNTCGGEYGNGSLFSVDVSSTSLNSIYTFGKDEGRFPSYIGQIQADNGNLFGLVFYGDNTGNFYYIYEFDPINNTYDEKCKFNCEFPPIPRTGITLAQNGVIYGTCQYTGEYNKGSIFKYNIQNDEFCDVYFFQGNPDGDRPMGSLLNASDGMLYGVTRSGGQHQGSIYSVDPENSEYEQLAKFNIDNGRYPESGLIEGPDELLYGLTSMGGDHGKGVIYSFNTTNSIIIKLHSFDEINGALPTGKLLHTSDGNLYGFTHEGGCNNQGVLFSFNIYTNTFEKIIDMEDSVTGSNPISSLVLAADGNIYGLTSYGGEQGGGCLFEYDPSNNCITSRHHFGHNVHYGSLMQASDGNLYGTTGYYLFEFDIISKKYIKRMKFGSCLEGRLPSYCLSEALNGKLYGATIAGGQFDNGVLFELDPPTNSYSVIIDFKTDGDKNPNNIEMVLTPEGKMLGTNSRGGEDNYGCIFMFDPDSYSYDIVAEFDCDITGYRPTGALVLGNDGNYYGRTDAGGAHHGGGIFKFTSENNSIHALYDFPMTSYNAYPNLVLADNGNFYGVVIYFHCGGQDPMYLFEFNPTENHFQLVYEFTEIRTPGRLLLTNNGEIYGFTSRGGDYDQGVFFEFDTETAQCIVKHNFEFSISNYYIRGEIMQASNGNFYGIASNSWSGTIFEYDMANEECNEIATIWFPGGSTLGNPSFCLTEILNLASINEPPEEKISVYPNPFNNYIIIKAEEHLFTEYKIYDLNGSEVISGTFKGKTIETINLRNLKPGLYFIKIFGEDLLHLQKIIKTR